MNVFNKEKPKKPEVKPDSRIPKQGQPVDLSKVIIPFTGVEVDKILQYLSKRPWGEVTNLMDMLRIKLSNTKVGEDSINIEIKEKKENENSN